jgi:hypothetical protein
MAPAKKAPALFAQLHKSLEKEGDELAAKVKVSWPLCHGSLRLQHAAASTVDNERIAVNDERHD